MCYSICNCDVVIINKIEGDTSLASADVCYTDTLIDFMILQAVQQLLATIFWIRIAIFLL